MRDAPEVVRKNREQRWDKKGSKKHSCVCLADTGAGQAEKVDKNVRWIEGHMVRLENKQDKMME